MRRRSTRTTALLPFALAAVVAFGGVACSDSDDKADDTTTTEKKETEKESTTTEPTGEGDTGDEPAALSDEDFAAALAEPTAALEAAEDPCAVINAMSSMSEVPDPEGEAQTRTAVEFLGLMIERMAATATDPANAEELRAAGEAYVAFAEENDFDPEVMDMGGDGPDMEEMATLETAMDTYMNANMANCMGDVPAGGDTATSTP